MYALIHKYKQTHETNKHQQSKLKTLKINKGTQRERGGEEKSTESEKRIDNRRETETSEIGRYNDGGDRNFERRVKLRHELHVNYLRCIFAFDIHFTTLNYPIACYRATKRRRGRRQR